MSFFGFFENLGKEVVGFFEQHGQAALLDLAKKVVPEVETFVKAEVAKVEAKAENVLPIIEAFVGKYVSDSATVKTFLDSIVNLIETDLPTVYQKVAAFVISNLSSNPTVAHLINLAIEFVYSTVVKL